MAICEYGNCRLADGEPKVGPDAVRPVGNCPGALGDEVMLYPAGPVNGTV